MSDLTKNNRSGVLIPLARVGMTFGGNSEDGNRIDASVLPDTPLEQGITNGEDISSLKNSNTRVIGNLKSNKPSPQPQSDQLFHNMYHHRIQND